MTKGSTSVPATRKPDDAAELMWCYYKANKSNLQPDIRESREFILSELIAGKEPDLVFSDFMLPADVIAARLLAASKALK